MTIRKTEISEIDPSDYNLILRNCSKILSVSCPYTDNWKITVNRSKENVLFLFPNEKYSYFIWTRTPSYLAPNIIQRTQKLWKSKSMLWAKTISNKSENLNHEDNHGVFYSGILNLNENNLEEALDYVRKNLDSIFFIADEEIKELSDIDNFLADKKNKLEEKIDFLLSLNLIPCKINGLFDDNELNLIFFFNKNNS